MVPQQTLVPQQPGAARGESRATPQQTTGTERAGASAAGEGDARPRWEQEIQAHLDKQHGPNCTDQDALRVRTNIVILPAEHSLLCSKQ